MTYSKNDKNSAAHDDGDDDDVNLFFQFGNLNSFRRSAHQQQAENLYFWKMENIYIHNCKEFTSSSSPSSCAAAFLSFLEYPP